MFNRRIGESNENKSKERHHCDAYQGIKLGFVLRSDGVYILWDLNACR